MQVGFMIGGLIMDIGGGDLLFAGLGKLLKVLKLGITKLFAKIATTKFGKLVQKVSRKAFGSGSIRTIFSASMPDSTRVGFLGTPLNKATTESVDALAEFADAGRLGASQAADDLVDTDALLAQVRDRLNRPMESIDDTLSRPNFNLGSIISNAADDVVPPAGQYDSFVGESFRSWGTDMPFNGQDVLSTTSSGGNLHPSIFTETFSRSVSNDVVQKTMATQTAGGGVPFIADTSGTISGIPTRTPSSISSTEGVPSIRPSHSADGTPRVNADNNAYAITQAVFKGDTVDIKDVIKGMDPESPGYTWTDLDCVNFAVANPGMAGHAIARNQNIWNRLDDIATAVESGAADAAIMEAVKDVPWSVLKPAGLLNSAQRIGPEDWQRGMGDALMTQGRAAFTEWVEQGGIGTMDRWLKMVRGSLTEAIAEGSTQSNEFVDDLLRKIAKENPKFKSKLELYAFADASWFGKGVSEGLTRDVEELLQQDFMFYVKRDEMVKKMGSKEAYDAAFPGNPDGWMDDVALAKKIDYEYGHAPQVLADELDRYVYLNGARNGRLWDKAKEVTGLTDDRLTDFIVANLTHIESPNDLLGLKQLYRHADGVNFKHSVMVKAHIMHRKLYCTWW